MDTRADARIRRDLFAACGEPSGARRRALSRAFERFGLAVLSRMGSATLVGECGLTPRQAAQLDAAFALGRHAERARIEDRPALVRPVDVARYLAPRLRGLEVETFHALVLDTRRRLIESFEVGRGTIDAAPVHPREVFAPVLRLRGSALVVAHNHPSGDPTPSSADRAVTERLVDAGALLGVPLLDHVVIAADRWVSLRDRGPWPDPNRGNARPRTSVPIEGAPGRRAGSRERGR